LLARRAYRQDIREEVFIWGTGQLMTSDFRFLPWPYSTQGFSLSFGQQLQLENSHDERRKE
jgi:hypothetical protein